jgi:NSS family neurotransmitter:Na+ symporter
MLEGVFFGYDITNTMSSRGSFSGRFGFIMAAAGSAVGLGNIWRFPYLAGQNGGAPFLLIYLAFVLLLCFPVLVGEIAIGRKAGRMPMAPTESWAAGIGACSGSLVFSGVH